MSEYIFSICIPVYNTEQYLSRALDSIAQQTFDVKNVETIVVNDCSPHADKCGNIVAEYSCRLNIHYIQKIKNEGSFLARKIAVQNASGKYILFLDSDDSFEPHALRLIYEQLICEPDYVQFRMYSVVGREKSLFHSQVLDETHKTLQDVLQNKALHNLVDKCYRRQLLKQIFEEVPDSYTIYAEDYYHSAVIEYTAKKKIFLNIPLYNYFRGIGITSDSTFRDKKKVIRIIEDLHAIEHDLILFFEKKGEQQYVQYVKDCIRELYVNFAYWINSIFMLVFVIKHLPGENYSIRGTLFKKFIIHRIAIFAKNILPCFLVQFIKTRRKNRK